MTPDDARALRIELDRERVARGGLRELIHRGWSEVVPSERKWNWHIDCMAEHLDALRVGEIRNLVISVPPGCTKTITASVYFPAHCWIEDPTERIIAATYGQTLSNEAAKLQTRLVKSEWFQARWGKGRPASSGLPVVLRSDAVQKIETTAGGFRFSTSVQGVATGQHAGIHIGDDLAKAQDADGRNVIDPVAIEKANNFWFSTFRTRRGDAGTLRRILIGQRLHDKDTPGKAIEAGYVPVVLPMEYDERRRCRTGWTRRDGTAATFEDPRTEQGELLDPVRFPRDVVEADKDPITGMGEAAFSAQMNQDPTPPEGLILKHAGNLRWTAVPKSARKIITVDCAFKDTASSDFVAIQVWAVERPHFYLVDQEYGRMGFGATAQAIARIKDRHPTAIGIYVEDKANGPAIIETLQGTIPGVLPWTPTGSKVARAQAVSPLFEKNVWLPPTDLAPWITVYVNELRKFPLVLHDDQVDATTMALLILHNPMESQYEEAVKKMMGRA